MNNKLKNPQKTNVIPHVFTKDGDGGGGDMTGFVTKHEFDQAVNQLNSQMQRNHSEILAKIDLTNQSIKSAEKLNDVKMDHHKESVDKVNSRLTTIIGIGVTSIVIPILLKLLGF